MTDAPVTSSSTQFAPPLPPLPQMLAGQTAIVTGANSGIGEAVAIALGQAGANVAINYVVGDDTANAVADKIRSLGVKAQAYKADVSNEDQVIADRKSVV